MKEIKIPKSVVTVELTMDEVEYIRNITQNYFGNIEDEDTKSKEIRKSLFVGSSKILGFNMNDDGTINRCI